MPEIAASLLAADFSCIGSQLEELIQENVRYVHIDIMDGIFVPSLAFGFPVVETLRKVYPHTFDVHLMVKEPRRFVRQFAECGSDIITVHAEACSDVRGTLEEIRACGCKAGIAVKPGTPWEVICSSLDLVDLVLIMTVEPGFGGQKYITAMTDKIRRCREYLDAHYPAIRIEVDGGINKETLREVIRAGSRLIVSGSSLFGGNLRENIEVFRGIISEEIQERFTQK